MADSLYCVMYRSTQGWYPSMAFQPSNVLRRAESWAEELRHSGFEAKVVSAGAAILAGELLELCKRVFHQLATDSDLDEIAGAAKYAGLRDELLQLIEQCESPA